MALIRQRYDGIRPEAKSKMKKASGVWWICGWWFWIGGHADATAKSGEKGAAAAGELYVENDIEIYQMTEAGIALQATEVGTYFQDYAELN